MLSTSVKNINKDQEGVRADYAVLLEALMNGEILKSDVIAKKELLEERSVAVQSGLAQISTFLNGMSSTTQSVITTLNQCLNDDNVPKGTRSRDPVPSRTKASAGSPGMYP